MNSLKSDCIATEYLKIKNVLSLSNGFSKHSDDSRLPEHSVMDCSETANLPNQELSNSAPNFCDTFQKSKDPVNNESHQTSENSCSTDSISNSDVHNNSTCDESDQSSVHDSPHDTEFSSNSPEAPSMSSTNDTNNGDLRRTRRNSKRKLGSDICCPICGITVRVPELDSHFSQEVEKLGKISKNMKKPKQDDSGINTTFVQIKSNRENRLTAKVAKYAAKAKKEVQCPVCNLRFSGSEEEVNKHVALCVQNDDNSDEHIIVDDDDEDDESFEEYEFGDQTRIRTISLVPGGYRSLEGQTTVCRPTDENEDLDVDIDDTIAYGQPQYSELDVIPNKAYGDDESSDFLRKAVVDPTAQPNILESRKWSDCGDFHEDSSEDSEKIPVDSPKKKNDDTQPKEQHNDKSCDPIISSLKEKIKELEDQNKSVKCLICMDSYTKPVVSTTCWHVHCEECWLMTMGVKKLCPQCNMIVFPSDLRRIYL